MTNKIIWQQGSNNPDNGENFSILCNWWANLQGKEIAFAQRLIPNNNNIDDIDWTTQRFDEIFTIQKSEIRGITLFWYKSGEQYERNLTPQKLELYPNRQQLDIYPQSQSQLIIRVTIPEIQYQLIELNNPQIVANSQGENCLFLLRDESQQIEVKFSLSLDKLSQLLKSLSKE